MNEKYYTLIETIDNKFGTTAEHLFDVLLRQAAISGVVDFILCSAITFATVKFVSVVIKKAKCINYDNDINKEKWRDDLSFFACFAAIIACFLDVAFIISSTRGLSTALLNPEYWALLKLSSMVQ